jgi:anti-anti-sigma factor
VRSAGPDGASSLSWDGHVVLVRASPDEWRPRFAAWVRRGLEQGEKVICTEGPAEPASLSLQVLLAAHGIDAGKATQQGRLVVLPAAQVYAAGGQLQLVDRAAAEGFPAVRMAAEARTGLAMLGEDEYAQFERTLDRLCRTRPLSALCQYDRELVTRDRVPQVAGLHLAGIQERQLCTSGTRHGVRVVGEIDRTNEELLTCVLRAATAEASESFQVDLRAVTFLGVAGYRALVSGTQAFRDRGGHVRLTVLRRGVEQVLRLLDIDGYPRLELISQTR